MDDKPILAKPKEAYIKRTLKFLKNAMRNVLKEYYDSANSNLKEKHNLELPTKEKFNQMYSKLTSYNHNKKSLLKMKQDELIELWSTAKKEIKTELLRLGKDGYDFDKETANDGLDLIPDVPNQDSYGVESLEDINMQEVQSMCNLSMIAIQKLHYLLSTSSNQDFANWYNVEGCKTLMQLVSSEHVYDNNIKFERHLDDALYKNTFHTSIEIPISPLIKQQIQDLLLKIDREKTTEQDLFILQIDTIVNKVVSLYHVSKNNTTSSYNPLSENPIVMDLSKIVGDECAINIFLLFYFDMLLQPHIVEIDKVIKDGISSITN